jgi:hypothetical protein
MTTLAALRIKEFSNSQIAVLDFVQGHGVLVTVGEEVGAWEAFASGDYAEGYDYLARLDGAWWIEANDPSFNTQVGSMTREDCDLAVTVPAQEDGRLWNTRDAVRAWRILRTGWENEILQEGW